MLRIDEDILNINNKLCENINLIDFKTVTRALVAQNLLNYSRNLVEHIAIKLYSQGRDVVAGLKTIPEAMEFIKRHNEYQFLRSFHRFLQESKSHYTPDDDEGAERLVLKYYEYYLLIREFMKKNFDMELLYNLEKFPRDTDKSIQKYFELIALKIDMTNSMGYWYYEPRFYVNKVVPFFALQRVYYQITLSPAYDTTSKFDRFVCYSSFWVPPYYSLKANIHPEDIILDGKSMPIYILSDYQVSIRPCELNNYASIFGCNIDIKSNHREYSGMMIYLTKSGTNLLEIVLSKEEEYLRIKKEMFSRSRTHYFENVLDKSRTMIMGNEPGSNILRYLLYMMNNKIIKNQHNNEENQFLSGLLLNYGCIPFDTMPFATSLIRHVPSSSDLFGSIESNGREHEFLARYLQVNMSVNSCLYIKECDIVERFSNVNELIGTFNSRLYQKHIGRRIEKFGKNLYVKEDYEKTKKIIEEFREKTQTGMKGYDGAILSWLNLQKDIKVEKQSVLKKLFSKTSVALIYGAAGTGKTYTINLISQFFGEKDKLYLTNTNPAIENLKRKVSAQNCTFLTIRKYLMSRNVKTEYDILILDECSMISNSDMAAILSKTKYRLILLVGDTYQIESITFGNWFSLAKHFIPETAWWELEDVNRTKNSNLVELWKRVRLLKPNLIEHIVSNRYSSSIDSSIFEKRAEDEIILCLNYDGLYGINNINRFLQKNNPNPEFRWGLWTFKVGDPILFNESERFAPALYNNLKGTIIDILENKDENEVWFSIEVDKALMEIDTDNLGLELLNPLNEGKSVVRFRVKKKMESDEDKNTVDETDLPFQVAYAVSIHKAQGLEYDSVKVIITRDIDKMITHNIFYTAITRTKNLLKIYWSPETMNNVINNLEEKNVINDANIFSAHSSIKKYKLIRQ